MEVYLPVGILWRANLLRSFIFLLSNCLILLLSWFNKMYFFINILYNSKTILFQHFFWVYVANHLGKQLSFSRIELSEYYLYLLFFTLRRSILKSYFFYKINILSFLIDTGYVTNDTLEYYIISYTLLPWTIYTV